MMCDVIDLNSIKNYITPTFLLDNRRQRYASENSYLLRSICNMHSYMHITKDNFPFPISKMHAVIKSVQEHDYHDHHE